MPLNVDAEALSHRDRTLIIVGGGHCFRSKGFMGFDKARGVRTLDRLYPGRICVILTPPGREGAAPAFAEKFAFSKDEIRLFHPIKGTEVGRMKSQLAMGSSGRRRFQDMGDAVLYLGAGDDEHIEANPAIYDDAYRAQLYHRANLIWPDGGIFKEQLESVLDTVDVADGN